MTAATAATTSTAAPTARRRRALALACSVLVVGPVGACSGGDGSTGEPAGLSAPRGARDTAAFVDDAVAGEHGEPDDAIVRLYAEVTADRLPDFARDNVTDDPPHASADGDTVVVGSAPASRFVALALATDDGRERVAEAHRAAGLDLAVAGLAAEGPGTGAGAEAGAGAGPEGDWRTRLGKLDAIVAAARAGDDPGGDANLVVAGAQDAEERTVVAAYLVTALRSEAEGTLGPTSQAIIGVAEATMPAAALAEVRTRVTDAGSAERAAADLAPDLGSGPGARGSLAGALDRLREGFAGHEEYPVEATMFAVFDAHARHFRAATAHPPGG